jgi:hypothetical protein
MLRGNPSKTPINLREPVVPPGEVVIPAEISQSGAVVWARLAPIAIGLGTLSPADVEPFKVLCELQATIDRAARATDAPEFSAFTVIDDGESAPVVVVHAALKLVARLAPVIRPYYEKFGLEPVSRARLQTGPAREPVNKWGALAGG